MKNLLINQDVISTLESHIEKNYPKTKQQLWFARYAYIFDRIYTVSSYYSDRGATINIKETSKLFDIHNKSVSKIMKFYLDNKIIRCTRGYVVGVSAKQYKINKKYTQNIKLLHLLLLQQVFW